MYRDAARLSPSHRGVVHVIGYGMLRGRVDRWVREDGDATPHLQVRVVDDTAQPWRIAVNVQPDTGSEVVYWLVDPLPDHPILAGLANRPSGFSVAAPQSSTCLDYVRAPLFEWPAGTALPARGDASADDLQDLLAVQLQGCRDADAEVFAFGERFDRNLHKPIDVDFGNTDGLHGIHDIHLNQGNRGPHATDNGPLQDGGLIFGMPDRYVGLFLAFQTQCIPTDADGDPTTDAESIAEVISGAPTSAAAVYLERALLNPPGDDVGQEAVVIGNLANAASSLHGWQLLDKTQRSTALEIVDIAPGGSVVVALDGSGVQLGNNGGRLTLLDHRGTVVDAVAYAREDAVENVFVRFRR